MQPYLHLLRTYICLHGVNSSASKLFSYFSVYIFQLHVLFSVLFYIKLQHNYVQYLLFFKDYQCLCLNFSTITEKSVAILEGHINGLLFGLKVTRDLRYIFCIVLDYIRHEKGSGEIWTVSLVWPAQRARANTAVLKQLSDLIGQQGCTGAGQ